MSTVPKNTPDVSFEISARNRGFLRIAGVDEAGRGPLAGPVTAAAVILDPDAIPAGLNDSKALSAKRRAALAEEIWATAEVSVVHAPPTEIDRRNIRGATLAAMARAVASLRADYALIDGNALPDLPCPGETVVKGDARALSIAAASIVAKESRDALMVDLAQQYPGYGFEKHAGYPTKAHLQALQDLGVTPAHRRSFKPVHNILCQDKNTTT